MTTIIHGSSQELFTKSVTHLLTQGKKSQRQRIGRSDYQCLYWNPESGDRCAVGCLIPDQAVCQDIDDLRDASILTLIQESELSFPDVHNTTLLDDLQDCHDEYAVEEWPQRLEEIAKKYGLDFPTVPQKG